MFSFHHKKTDCYEIVNEFLENSKQAKTIHINSITYQIKTFINKCNLPNDNYEYERKKTKNL